MHQSIRDVQDQQRLATALNNPKRREFQDPLDARLECTLGRLAARGKINEDEYQAGVRWRENYFQYLVSMGAPFPFPSAINDVVTGDGPLLADEICENLARSHKHGCKILESLGKRVLHAVNAIAVFDEPEELGDFEFTLSAARKGLAALARNF